MRSALTTRGRVTSTRLIVPTLLAIDCNAELLERCRRAAACTGIVVADATAATASTVATARQPLAIVMPVEVHGRDPDELDALARDVRAALLTVDAEVTVRELEAMIASVITTRFSERERRASAGRYSIIHGGAVDVTRPRAAARAAQVTARHTTSVANAPHAPTATEAPPARAEPSRKPPSSGVRPRCDDEIDRIFEEQGLPLEALMGAVPRVSAAS
jgi:hypothetical protein